MVGESEDLGDLLSDKLHLGLFYTIREVNRA